LFEINLSMFDKRITMKNGCVRVKGEIIMFRKKVGSIILMTLLFSLITAGTMFKCDAKSEKVVTINFSAVKDVTHATQAVIAAFEKKFPNIRVNLQELPTGIDNLHNTYATAFTAGDSSIDAFQIDVTWAPEFISADWALPLNKLFTQAERQKFIPRTVQAMTYKGKICAVPRTTESGVLYYRKDIVKKPPETWDDLIQACKENIGKNGIKNGYVFQCIQTEAFVCNILEVINSNGGSIIKGKKITVNSPQVVHALQYMKDIIHEQLAPAGVTTYKEIDSFAIFKQGATLFMRNWCYYASLIDKDDFLKDKVGIVPIPLGKEGKERCGILGGWNVAINKYSKHPKEAWKFISFLTGEEGQKINFQVGGRLPTREAIYFDQKINESNQYMKEFYTAMKTAKPRPLDPLYPKISETIQINFNKAVNGFIPIETAVQNVKKDLAQIIK
jgi:multiple sugar transport system substrate-binding protein